MKTSGSTFSLFLVIGVFWISCAHSHSRPQVISPNQTHGVQILIEALGESQGTGSYFRVQVNIVAFVGCNPDSIQIEVFDGNWRSVFSLNMNLVDDRFELHFLDEYLVNSRMTLNCLKGETFKLNFDDWK